MSVLSDFHPNQENSPIRSGRIETDEAAEAVVAAAVNPGNEWDYYYLQHKLEVLLKLKMKNVILLHI